MNMLKVEIEKTVRVGAETYDVLRRLKHLMKDWSGGDDELVHFYEPASPLLQYAPRPFAYWRIDGAAFEAYGPAPFTAGGRPVRWTWLYWLRNAPTLTVTDADLPS